MFNKNLLVSKVVNSLLSKDYEVLLSEGCFDIAAKKKNLLLIKTLINIDGLNQNQALSLRSISYFLSAAPLVVSVKNNREFLGDEMIYSRFQLPVITPSMFDSILEEEAVFSQSAKGRHTVTINTGELRKKREELGFSLQELAELIGMSKKSLYEIENRRVNPTTETVRKLEDALRIELKSTYEPEKTKNPTYLKPKNEFQSKVSKEFSRIGIDNSSVYSAPFEIIGKEKFSLITTLSKNTDRIKKDAGVVKKISSIFSSKALFVSKKSKEKSVEGVPVVLDSELSDIESSKELKKIMEEKE